MINQRIKKVLIDKLIVKINTTQKAPSIKSFLYIIKHLNLTTTAVRIHQPVTINT